MEKEWKGKGRRESKLKEGKEMEGGKRKSSGEKRERKWKEGKEMKGETQVMSKEGR